MKFATVKLLAMLMAPGSWLFASAAVAAPNPTPAFGTYRVAARSTSQHNFNFDRGDDIIIYVSGDGDTDLDLYVYDAYGRLVNKDDDYTDECVAQFRAPVNGSYTMRVVNRGSVYNEYSLRFAD